jgi:HAD superfamily hydrolase (TIGR01549 family)
MFITPYKAIIFDFDETLVRAMGVKWKQHQDAAKQFYDHELTEEIIRTYWGMPFEPMIQLFYDNKDTVENMKKNYHSLDELYPKYPFEDTIEVLTYLQSHSYWTGVITSMTKESVIKDMKKDGLPYERFNLIQGSTDSTFHKPDPRVFDDVKKILKKISISHNETLYVGDDIRDMQAANEAGIQFVAIPNGLTSKEEFIKRGAKCISSLSELIS